ncbi:MAG: hypothetical protein RLZZ628_1682 [Bacteroidota bacterium]|jgi:DNA-directed RNA polymerase specialized sigma24 family protein
MFFFKKEDNESFNLELKAGGKIQNKAFGKLQAKIEANVTKYCRQYRIADVENVLQETLIEMFVQIGNGKYPPKGDMSYSPIAFATKIGYYKTLEALPSRKQELPIVSISDEELRNIAEELQLTDWEQVNKIVNHLKEKMKGICADLIWKVKAEKRSYKEIHPDYPQYKEQEGLRNQVSKCLKQWRELLDQTDLIKKKKQ